MALTEKITYQVEVTDTDVVQVRTKRTIFDNGVEIAATNHRHVILPDTDYSGEIGKVRRVCANTLVPTVVARYEALKRKEAALEGRDNASWDRQQDDTPETQAAEEAAEQALLDAEAEHEAAEAAHEAFLASEDA